MSLRVVLAGCGAIANAAHLPALVALRAEGALDLVGVSDSNVTAANAAATAFNIPYSGSNLLDVARDSEATAVVLCVPPGPNVDLAVAALERGLHVLTEKPPARTLAQAERMAEAARQRPDLVTMIGFNRRYAPLYRRAIEASLALGAPHAFSGRFTRASLGLLPSNTADDWITSDGSHALDLAIATIGLPSYVALSRRRVGADRDNVWTIHFESPRGAAVLSFDFSAGRRVERFEWSGPGYDVALELPERGEFAVRGAEPEQWRTPQGHESSIPVSYGFMDTHRAFAAAIGRPSLASSPEPPASSPDFSYGATFMRLVETLLDMRSGESRPFPHTADLPSTSASAPPPPQRPPADRPSVLILQDAAARRRMFDTGQLTRIAERGHVAARDDDRWRIALDAARVIVAGWGGVPLNRDDLDRARDLALVVVAGSSLRSVEPEYLLDRGVTVCNTAGAIAVSVAEHCLALTMAGLRRLSTLDRQMHGGAWPPLGSSRLRAVKDTVKRLPGIGRATPWLQPIGRSIESFAGGGDRSTAHDLHGTVVSLIGWGEIARRFADLLAPFQCELFCYSEAADDEELRAHGVRRAGLGEALGAARVISLHRGLTERTRGMIGRREIGLIAAGTVLVNTARGELIDEAALLDRLQRRDMVCALDVFAHEPLPARHALRKQPNVLLTPHSASSTPECQRRVGRQALAIVSDWMDGKPLAGITRKRLARMT